MAEFPQLPGRSGDSLRAWLSAGGVLDFAREVGAWRNTLPTDFLGYRPGLGRAEANVLGAWGAQARGRLEYFDWLYPAKHAADGSPPEEWERESVPWVEWARDLPVNRLYRALKDVDTARAAKSAKAPGARGQVADALERANGVQAAAEREYEQVRVGVNDAIAQVAASTRVGSKTPSTPALVPVTLK